MAAGDTAGMGQLLERGIDRAAERASERAAERAAERARMKEHRLDLAHHEAGHAAAMAFTGVWYDGLQGIHITRSGRDDGFMTLGGAMAAWSLPVLLRGISLRIAGHDSFRDPETGTVVRPDRLIWRLGLMECIPYLSGMVAQMKTGHVTLLDIFP